MKIEIEIKTRKDEQGRTRASIHVAAHEQNVPMIEGELGLALIERIKAAWLKMKQERGLAVDTEHEQLTVKTVEPPNPARN